MKGANVSLGYHEVSVWTRILNVSHGEAKAAALI